MSVAWMAVEWLQTDRSLGIMDAPFGEKLTQRALELMHGARSEKASHALRIASRLGDLRDRITRKISQLVADKQVLIAPVHP